jgi:aquaporin Z
MIKRNRLLAEAIGTFALVFCGCGAIVVNDLLGAQLGHVGVSAVFGLVVTAMIYAFGNISGAHINPAVTIGFAAAGRFNRSAVLPYVGSQFAGAITAAVALKVLFPEHDGLGATIPSGSLAQALAMEVLLSFLLMLVILNASTGHMEKGIMAGVAIGATVGLEALIGGPVTGASMNPARSFGPAIVSFNLDALWLYLAAPVVGMLLAAPTCRWIQGDECCSPGLADGEAHV